MIKKIDPPDCEHVLLSSSAIGHVMTCPDCGQVHVALHSMTLRFKLEAFLELAAMVRTAQEQLAVESDRHGMEFSMPAPTGMHH